MTQAKYGDKVQIHYKACREDGSLVVNTQGRQPIEAELGSGQLISGLERGVVGMEVGERRTVRVPPQLGYGEWDPQLSFDMSRNDFPDDIVPTVGKYVRARQGDGRFIHVTISRVTADFVTLDANHPLAGETLTFHIQLVGLS